MRLAYDGRENEEGKNMLDRLVKGAMIGAVCVSLSFGVYGCSSTETDPASCPAQSDEVASAEVEDTVVEDTPNVAVLPIPNESLAWTMGSAEEDGFQPIALGESAVVGECSFDVREASWKTGEYWLPSEGTPCTSTSYDVEQGTALLLLRGIYENPTDEPANVSGSVGVRAMLDGVGAYEGWADIASYYGEMVGQAAPGEKGDFVVGIPVPEDAMADFAQAEVRFEILDASGLPQASYCLSLDSSELS